MVKISGTICYQKAQLSVHADSSYRFDMRHFLKKFCASVALLVLALPVGSATLEKTYSNGLKLIVREDHRAPVVVSQIWYRVGSSYEHEGITGISHALEHLMFKGTPSFPGGEFSRIIAENGGQDNAFTSKHYTAYYQRIASDRLEIPLQLEADRMTNLLFDDEEFKREMEVIKEERSQRVDNNPLTQFYEKFIATAFIRSPVRHPIIGWPLDIERLTMAQARAWYQRWYAPNNATLVIVGDVEFDEVDRLVARYFGPIKSRPIKPLGPLLEAPQNGQKIIHGYGDTSSSYLLMAYRAPVIAQLDEAGDAYALEVLSGILDGGNSARFSRYLQRDQEFAISASVGYDAFDRLQGLFSITATPKPGIALEVLQSAIESQIDDLKTRPVSEEELQRVKAQVVSGRIYQQDSLFYMALQIGMFETAGLDWRLLDGYVDAINRVSADDVQRVARRYLNPRGLTLGKFWPEDKQP